MSAFLKSVKADLLDRRMLPLVAIVGVVLVAAVAYALLGGGSAGSPKLASIPVGTGTPTGLTVSQSNATEAAVSETTDGTSVQHHGVARNPFKPLPEAKAKTASSTSSQPSSSPASSSGSSSSSSPTPKSAESSTPPAPKKPAAPAKPKTVYHVAVLFGELPAGTSPQSAQLTPYENVKLLSPFPASGQALVVFRGVTAGGKSATFTLVGEAILSGQGTCLPSATQCEAVDLQPGQAEQLQYVPAGGAAVTYELRVVTIASEKATGAAVKRVLGEESKVGRSLLGHDGLQAVPFMHYSSQPGVLVFSSHHAFASRAHSSRHR